MFRNPIASQLDQPVYQPSKYYKYYDTALFWQEIEYNNNLFKL
jgi:hypothetical protein